ncbi:MAG TPA: hypothetical protein VMU85_11230 [Stellaceae bacterium]|nr:hypothetical protein [Stellaceae bacterium]
MGTPHRSRSAALGQAAFPEFSDLCAGATPADIVIAWAVVLAAIGGMLLLSGLG